MPKKPLTEITQEELNQEANEGASAQKTELDKLWYYLNYYSLYGTVKNAWSLNRDPRKRVLEEPDAPEDPEEIDKAVQEYIENYKDGHYQNGEREKVQVPMDEASLTKISRATNVVDNDIRANALHFSTYERRQKSYKLLGLLQAKLAMECGKDYEEKLNSLPEDEPNREEKAEYLHLMDLYGKPQTMTRAFKDLQSDTYMGNADFYDEIMKDSPIPDVNALKNMTLGEFLDSSFTSEEEQQLFFRESTEQLGFPCHRGLNVYDFYKRRQEAEQQKMKRHDPNHQIEEVTDDIIYDAAKKHFIQDLMRDVTRLSSNAVRENLSEQEKKIFDKGMKLVNKKEYKPPKEIREWVKKTGFPMLLNKRADSLNKRYKEFSDEADRRTVFGLQNDPIFNKISGKQLGPQLSDYEKFLHEHLGPKAIMDRPAERRKHLAMIMAANAWNLKHPDRFDRKAVEKDAESYANLDVFRNFSDHDVIKAISSRQRANEAPHAMLQKKFGVPEQNRTEYIRKMKELSESMVPSKGKSEKYRNMKKAVDAIAALDPMDPQIEQKLIRANGTLIGHTLDYTKGKKSMRTYQSSQDRFDNSIDVLSVVNDHVPGLRRFAKQVVDKTNLVRKVKPGDPNFVDISAYGTERALRHAPKDAPAYERRIEAATNQWLKEAGFDPDAIKKEHQQAMGLGVGN